MVIVSAVILLNIIPIPVKKEINAKEIKVDDPSYIEDTNIYISGVYHFNIFSDDTFDYLGSTFSEYVYSDLY